MVKNKEKKIVVKTASLTIFWNRMEQKIRLTRKTAGE